MATKRLKTLTKDALRTIATVIVETPESYDEEVIALAHDWLDSNPPRQELPANLTERQRQVVSVFQKSGGRPPTVREIAKVMGIASPNGVMCHLHALERKGVVVRSEYSSRGTVLAECYR